MEFCIQFMGTAFDSKSAFRASRQSNEVLLNDEYLQVKRKLMLKTLHSGDDIGLACSDVWRRMTGNGISIFSDVLEHGIYEAP